MTVTTAAFHATASASQLLAVSDSSSSTLQDVWGGRQDMGTFSELMIASDEWAGTAEAP